MKTDTAHSFRFAWLSVSMYMLATLLLAGCGDVALTTDAGSSGSGQIIAGVGVGGTGVIKAARLEPVVDSGLAGAVVFLDKNNNRLPDQDEPSATTDQDGRYILPLDPAEEAAYPLLMQQIAGITISKATGQVVTSTAVFELSQPSEGQ